MKLHEKREQARASCRRKIADLQIRRIGRLACLNWWGEGLGGGIGEGRRAEALFRELARSANPRRACLAFANVQEPRCTGRARSVRWQQAVPDPLDFAGHEDVGILRVVHAVWSPKPRAPQYFCFQSYQLSLESFDILLLEASNR